MSAAATLRTLRRRRDEARPEGITSVCSAHPTVIEAAVLQALADGADLLVEATCNQVNQEGGYTGLTPSAFRDRVHGIADRAGLARERLTLGGDHLGPNPWKHLPATEAMARAGRMVEAYAEAGYGKLHLDCSMGCAGEPAALPDDVVASRAAFLASLAERAAAPEAPVYVIGTEVPTPGGATEALDHLRPTAPASVRRTFDIHRDAFGDVAGGAVWERVIAMVVQPGVEFGDRTVAEYRPDRAAALGRTLEALPGLVFEAHSTDYQPETALAALVRDGFPILKVGPELTFALREALYGLDAIAAALDPGRPRLPDEMERLMLRDPVHWRSHYRGSEAEQRALRHDGYSDRIRYYWPEPEAERAVASLFDALGDHPVDAALLGRFLPRQAGPAISGAIVATPRALVIEAVRDVLRRYGRACAHRPSVV